MPVDATVESYRDLVSRGTVLVDFWGPRCQPCLALMPAVEALEDRHDGKLRLVKVNAPENRAICRELGVLGLPTYLLYRNGVEVQRLTGDPTRSEIEAAVANVLQEGGSA
jgi:thioredoxin 1